MQSVHIRMNSSLRPPLKKSSAYVFPFLFLHMGTTVVFKQELGTYIPVNNTYVKQFTEKKRRVSSAYSRRSAEIQSGPGALFKCCF